MLKRLKKTWKEEEAQSKKSQSPAPAEEVIAPLPTPIHPEVTPDVSQNHESVSGCGPKRSRDDFEPDAVDVAVSERPAKLLKTTDLDSLRNHLPEIIDSRERDEGGVRLSLLTLKERIFEQAKSENSKSMILLCLHSCMLTPPPISYRRYSAYKSLHQSIG
ncbi:hypothetical protein BDZ97DRAFT_4035 [Flammula alnicola]|nr:hypothetical protein BDZ97DRAFT_4035 [Flammula alnicola]